MATLRLILLLAVFAASSVRAQLKPEPAEIDLGRLHQHVTVTREVTLTNPTSAPLRITRILTDCACTAAEPAEKEIPAGGKTKLTITAESRTYQGDTEQRVRVQTSRGEAVITLKMNVAPYGDWDLDPSPLVLNPSQRSAESTGEITAHYVGKSAVKLTGVTSDADWLSAKISPGPDARTFLIAIRKSPAAPVGSPAGHLELKTDNPAQPTLSVAIFAIVTPTVKVSPNLITLPVVKPGATARATFRVVAWDDPVPPNVFTSFGEVRATGREGNDYLFELVVTPKAAGTATEQLQICAGKVVQLEVPFVVRAEK